MMDIETRSILSELLNLASRQKVKLFIVGGTLRDHIMHKNISDIDLTGTNAAALAIQFAHSLNFRHISLDKTPGRSTTRIILPQKKHFDLTDMQGATIKEDLGKRDFTINSMGQELSDYLSNKKTIIDLHNGKKDLNKALIRATSKSIFQTDPLRMLRAFRFAAKMNFSIDEETLQEISLYRKNISTAAGERVWQELLSFFEADNTGVLINLMQKSKLLSCILPDFFTDWDEILTSYKRLENIILNMGLYFPRLTPKLNPSEKALLKFSVLLKEIDKSLPKENINKKNYGIPNAFNTLKALKASNNEIVYICKTIKNLHVFSNSLSSNLNNSSMYDLCVIGGDQLVASLLLKACSHPMLDGLELPNNKKLYPCTQLLEFYFGNYLPVLGEKALLNGNDLIRIFNILPSPSLGNVLQSIQRAQVLGEIKTSKEAKDLAEKLLKS